MDRQALFICLDDDKIRACLSWENSNKLQHFDPPHLKKCTVKEDTFVLVLSQEESPLLN